MSGHKTNAARHLDSLGVRYEIREYEVNPEEFSAMVVAEKIALPPEQVFKTLLCVTVGARTCLCCGAGRCGAGL